MSTATLPERTDVSGHVTLHEQGMAIQTDLPFNEWRELGRRLLQTSDRALWSLGDWWLYGERFSKEHYDALREIEASSRLVRVGARVARAFPETRRRGQLTFEIHAVVASEEPAEQDRWLDEAERQGWNRDQLAFEFTNAIPKVPVAALSVRLVSDYHSLALRAAERRSMDPKDWVLEAIREKAAREHVTLEEVAA